MCPPPPVALVGSGEFLPVMEVVDRILLDGRAPKVVFLPTASAEEGPDTVEYWVRLASPTTPGWASRPCRCKCSTGPAPTTRPWRGRSPEPGSSTSRAGTPVPRRHPGTSPTPRYR